jgi:predicted deacetylase
MAHNQEIVRATTVSKAPARETGPSLLASIHDVGPRSEGAVDQLADMFVRRMETPRYAMLVVPNHWGEAPIVPGSPFATRLRAWADAGIEMFLHGWFHKDDAPHARAVDRLRARHMTAGEGEFLGLDYITARDRMVRGRGLVENIIGRPVLGFIAPAWLYGQGARCAARDCGFDLAEDHFRVWSPMLDDKIVARGPVITWASRSRARIVSSIAVATAARAFLPRRPAMRLGVHPGDTRVPAILQSIDKTLVSLSHGARFGRYAELVD